MNEKNNNWKDERIAEINAMGYVCDDSHPCFDEVQAIYGSNAKTYAEFREQFDGVIGYCGT